MTRSCPDCDDRPVQVREWCRRCYERRRLARMFDTDAPPTRASRALAIIAEAEFFCDEGIARLLESTGYQGRPASLCRALYRWGRPDLANPVAAYEFRLRSKRKATA